MLSTTSRRLERAHWRGLLLLTAAFSTTSSTALLARRSRRGPLAGVRLPQSSWYVRNASQISSLLLTSRGRSESRRTFSSRHRTSSAVSG